MIKSFSLAILMLAVSAAAFQCKKNNGRTGECLKGKVIDAMCASYIVQITGGNYDPSLVVNSWQDPHTGNTYTNVFAVSNFCDLQGKIATGDEFSFYFTDDAITEDCATCLAIRPTPSKANKVKLTTSCDD
jgi:hypothetical protein